jgi:hypothetical protein
MTLSTLAVAGGALANTVSYKVLSNGTCTPQSTCQKISPSGQPAGTTNVYDTVAKTFTTTIPGSAPAVLYFSNNIANKTVCLETYPTPGPQSPAFCQNNANNYALQVVRATYGSPLVTMNTAVTMNSTLFGKLRFLIKGATFVPKKS